MLIERAELTSGSTWHAAGGFHTLNRDPNVAKLQAYTVGLYKEIEEISGQSCGLHLTGGLQLADTPERLDWLKMAHARGRYLGMETEIISAAEAKKLLPLIDEKLFRRRACGTRSRAISTPTARRTPMPSRRASPAPRSVLHSRVTELHAERRRHLEGRHRAGQRSRPSTSSTAGGLWAREIGRMVGLELPVLAMEHHYILTEDMPEVAEINARPARRSSTPSTSPARSIRARSARGMLLGTYEKAGDAVVAEGDALGFRPGPAASPISTASRPRWRSASSISRRSRRPASAAIINGPFTFAPDGNPLVGPVQGLRNFWCACAVMAGFSQGGGVGLALSNWMVEGDPGFDVWAMDVARFGDWATLGYTNAKVRENYSRRFRIRFPNEELPAARPHADHGALRQDDRAGRRDGRQLGAGDAALVRARRASSRRTSSPSAAPTIFRM